MIRRTFIAGWFVGAGFGGALVGIVSAVVLVPLNTPPRIEATNISLSRTVAVLAADQLAQSRAAEQRIQQIQAQLDRASAERAVFRRLAGLLADKLDNAGIDWTNAIEQINIDENEAKTGIEIEIKPGLNTIYHEPSNVLKMLGP